MLKKPYLPSYRNGVHIQFCNDFCSLCDENDPAALNIAAKLIVFKGGILKMETAYKIMQGSLITAKIIEEDNVRDNYIIGIEKLAEAFTHHYNPDFVDAANLILKHIHKYGNSVARLSYQNETTALNDLIDNQKNDTALNAAVTLIGILDWFTELEESNNRFKSLYINRVKDNAEKPDEPLKELRKQSFADYKELEKHINANYVLNHSEAYEKFVKEANQLIDKYNAVNKKAKKGGDDPADE